MILFDYSLFSDDLYFSLVKEVSYFSEVLNKALVENGPHIISRYLLNLAALFNKFYSFHKIVVDDEVIRNTNLSLIYSVRVVLNEGMRLLNIVALNKM